MTRARMGVAGLLMGLGLLAGLAVAPAPAAAQACAGAWDAKGGSNFGPCLATGKASGGPSLYRRLGRREGIALVVDDFTDNMAADPRVNARFKALQPVQLQKFKSNLADHICEASGGPCSYLGREMKAVHQGMKVTEAEWSATVENLVKALDKHKVDVRSKDDLLGMLGPMKKDIVGQ